MKFFKFEKVSHVQFISVLKKAQADCENVAKATTPYDQVLNDPEACYYIGTLNLNDRYWSSHIPLAGFCVSNGELTSLFSKVKGKGKFVMFEALKRGAKRLDCFDGFLPEFYSKFGFKVVRREANWIPGGPDVVFMERI